MGRGLKLTAVVASASQTLGQVLLLSVISVCLSFSIMADSLASACNTLHDTASAVSFSSSGLLALPLQMEF